MLNPIDSIFKLLLIVFCILLVHVSVAQQHGMISGKVLDNVNRPLELVNVVIYGQPGGTTTRGDGTYSLQIPANEKLTIVYSFVGFKADTLLITVNAGEKIRINRTLIPEATVLQSVVVEDKILRTTNLTRINPKTVTALPSASSGIEAMLKTMAGVVSNNELSSQYSVRGGSYDENLVYVNDIEIYRPFLVRSGQQEGLSFLNSDLVSSVLFSSGGFEARYGDKLSSVLDIRYKHPQEFSASVTASLLGATAHVEDATDNGRFTYLMGARYKTNQYLLNALDTKGNYKPAFLDFQSLLTYDLNEETEISFLGYVSNNSYTLIPKSQDTRFGTLNEPMRLHVYYEGQEVDKYNSRLGAITITHKPNKYLQTKLITSAYQSHETESYDILGQYFIALLDNNAAAEDSIEVIETRGVGGYLTHARNKLDMLIWNAENRYSYVKGNSYAQWGIKYQHEQVSDRISEWQLIDSAGYSVPNNAGTPGEEGNISDFVLNYLFKTSAKLNSNRYTAFVQNTWTFDKDSTLLSFTIGTRFQYWDLNKQAIVSPRASISYKPNWKRNILFRFSTGVYYQPPFFRELRNAEGQINYNLKAQQSIHAVLGSDWNFIAWTRPFKFVTEMYYKHLSNLVPYEVDNVRIKYLGKNASDGYAYGVDMKVNGEFVKGVESWFSLSYLKTAEDLYNDSYNQFLNKSGEVIKTGITVDDVVADTITVFPGYIPRPTDQRITFGIFFQDFLPMNPTFKVNLGFYFGSGLPTGAPNTPFYTHVFRLAPYRRVDLGLSKQIIGPESLRPATGFFKGFKALWISAEILNLLDISNTVSYNWVRDRENNQYGVPNYLTPRQINFKIGADL